MPMGCVRARCFGGCNDSFGAVTGQTFVNGTGVSHSLGFGPRIAYEGRGGIDVVRFTNPRTVISDLGGGGTTANVSLTNGAIVGFLGSQRLNSLTLNAGTKVSLIHGNSVLRTNTLSVSPTAELDVNNNAVIIHATASTRAAVLAEVLALVKSGINVNTGLIWRGPGINSSTAAGENAPLHALGALLNDFATVGMPPGPIKTDFRGVPVGINDILIGYTFYGDADVDDDIDATDYSLIDDAFNNDVRNGGWIRGDFDYNGLIDATDYSLIDNSFLQQGSPSVLAAAPAGAPLAALFSARPIEEPEDDEEPIVRPSVF